MNQQKSLLNLYYELINIHDNGTIICPYCDVVCKIYYEHQCIEKFIVFWGNVYVFINVKNNTKNMGFAFDFSNEEVIPYCNSIQYSFAHNVPLKQQMIDIFQKLKLASIL